ncbi:MAG: cation-transporting P-type ATPase [Gammaproteobacteria bacterium]|nr:cation-transporting P-type ATPase [Gammaproteobacteria bacterium]
MKLHQLSVAEAITTLHSDANGLASTTAAARLTEFGANTIQHAPTASPVLRLLRSFTHFFALVLWLAVLLAFVADGLQPGQGMGLLGYAILGVILINGLFSFWQEYRADQAISALEKLLPKHVKVFRDGAMTEMAVAELVPGDVVALEEGDEIPADCRVIECFGLRSNEATVTGESAAKNKQATSSNEEDLMQSPNILLAGTTVLSGQAKAIVFATGMHTEFGKIAHLTQGVRQRPSPLQREIIRVSRWVAGLALALGVLFFIIGEAIGLSFWANFMFAIGIIVANVPEGLLPTVTLALAMATQRMAKRNALIRHLPSVETLGSTSVICTDKTGTLTQNRMTVRQVYVGNEFIDVAQTASRPLQAYQHLFEVANYCNELKLTRNHGEIQPWGDPMEIALMQFGKSMLGDQASPARVDEIPFDTDRKRQTTVHQSAEGLIVYVKGAPETVLPRCNQIQQDSDITPIATDSQQQLTEAQEQMAGKGLRVLACAYRRIQPGYARETLEQELILVGLIGLEDPPRPEVPAALEKCRQAGIRTIMVTGDHPHTALAIAREIGLVRTVTPVVITGAQLRRFSPTELQLALDAEEIIFARVGADQKLRIVTALQAKKEVVAVTGDGVNDAPALKKADIGIAMGVSGTDVAKEAADMILLDDNFASIVSAIEEGRAVFDNIRKFLTYILTSNVPEIIPYLAFVLFKIPLPLTIIQILAVDLGTDMLPALALGAEPPHPSVMQRPPRPRQEPLLRWSLLSRAYLFLGIMEAIAAMSAFFYVLNQGGWNYGDSLATTTPLYLQATAACLGAIIVMQVANVFLCRDERESFMRFGLFSNHLIVAGIAVEIGLLLFIMYTPWGNQLFGTAPLSMDVWWFIAPFAFGMLVLEESRKAWARRSR